MVGVRLNVAIALGSNLGDREAQLRGAISALIPLLAQLHVSSFHETEPIDVAGPQPLFLNAAAVGDTQLSAPAILDVLLSTEQRFGRERPYEHAPRTIDLDLILYGDQIINTPTLRVPHPRFRERLFVLEPLVEIAPGWIDPVTGKTISQLLIELRHTP